MRCRGATGRPSRSRSSCCSTGIGRRSRARRRRRACAPSSPRSGRPVLDRLLALPGGWFLRDFHSPNLIWLPERQGRRQGRHHRLPGCAQRALRLRPRLAAAGCARRRAGGAGGASCSPTTAPRSAAREPGFDRAAFAAAYADFGAQRNTRLLGLWARLLQRDGKPQYLQHIPRTWGYLARNLRCARAGAAGGVVRPALPARAAQRRDLPG